MREKPRHYTLELSSRFSLKIINSLITFVQIPSSEDLFPIGSSSEEAFECSFTESLLVTAFINPCARSNHATHRAYNLAL